MAWTERLLLAHLALSASGVAALASPGDPIGSSVVIVRRVTAEMGPDKRDLNVGDGVRQDEAIEVARDGRGEIKFVDETKLALGPGARLVLDKFVYDPDQTSGTIALNLLKGAFRFVTGVASKPSYTIRVPNASITVRGTKFDTYVAPNNDTWLMLLEGAVEVCNTAGQCRVLDEPGKVIRIVNGNVLPPQRWAATPGRQTIAFDNAFPFVGTAPTLDPVPIFTRESLIWGLVPIIAPRGPRPPGNGPSGTPPSTRPPIPPRRAGTSVPVIPKRIVRKGGVPFLPKVLKLGSARPKLR